MATEPRRPASGAFPQAKPEDRYAGAVHTGRVASGSNPPHPAESFPPPTQPAVPDPGALPSNLRQYEEVRRREEEEFLKSNAKVIMAAEPHFQQPGAPAQQYDRDREVTYPIISEQTKKEMEAGRRAVEIATQSSERAREAGHEGIRRTVTEMGETGEQAEAKRKEAQRRRETWGDPPANVNRETIAGARTEGGTSPPHNEDEEAARQKIQDYIEREKEQREMEAAAAGETPPPSGSAPPPPLPSGSTPPPPPPAEPKS